MIYGQVQWLEAFGEDGSFERESGTAIERAAGRLVLGRAAHRSSLAACITPEALPCRYLQ
jgi:hypothetical protein